MDKGGGQQQHQLQAGPGRPQDACGRNQYVLHIISATRSLHSYWHRVVVVPFAVCHGGSCSTHCVANTNICCKIPVRKLCK